MKRFRQQHWFSFVANIALATLVALPVYAVSTLGTNISTDGNMIVNSGSGKMGVGTTTPAQLFSVHGNALISGNVSSVANITATGTLAVTGAATLSSTLGVTGASTLTGLTSMVQASSTRLSVHDTAYFGGTATTTINSAGNVSVAGTLGVTGATTLSATSTHTYISNGLGFAGAPSYTFTGDLNNGIWSSGADTINFSTAGAERARISSAGLLGIGSTTPIQLLSVQGNALISGDITSVANITATGTLAVTGAATLSSTLGVTGASTLTGLTSMVQASSTRLSVHDTAYFGGTATSSFTSAGVLTLQNGETISNSVNDTIALTAATTTLSGRGIFTTGYISQASSTVVGDLTVTGTFSPTASFQIGGGYGDTGTTLAATGDINTNGVLSLTGGTLNLGTGSATSTLTSASGLLGISSTTPSQLLSVQGNSYVSGTSYFGGAITATSTLTLSATSTHTYISNGLGAAGAPSYTFTGDLNNGMWSSAADTINFSTAGAERLRIDSSGRLGVGTTTPGTPLGVTGAGIFTGLLTSPNFDATSTTATSTLSTGGFAVGTNQFVVQQTSGNVGVATTSPTQLFSVQGNAYISGTSYFGGAITATSTLVLSATSTHTYVSNGLGSAGAPSYTFTGDLNNGMWSSAADTINFSTAGAERARIDSSGNLGIGTTTPGTPLGVTGAAVITGRVTSPSFEATSTTATTTLSTGGLAVGTNQFLVQQNSGNVGIGITNPNTKFEVVGTASTTNLIVGGNGTSLAGIVAGYCSFSDVTSFTASTTKYTDCTTTPTGALSTSHRVFVQATSSLQSMYVIQAASSTAASTINLRILNTGLDGAADTTLEGTSINFWAFK